MLHYIIIRLSFYFNFITFPDSKIHSTLAARSIHNTSRWKHLPLLFHMNIDNDMNNFDMNNIDNIDIDNTFQIMVWIWMIMFYTTLRCYFSTYER